MVVPKCIVQSLLLTAVGLAAGACGSSTVQSERLVSHPDAQEETGAIPIQDYGHGLSGVRATNPNVKLSVGRDPGLPDESVLLVEYPQPTGNPAERDVWCDVENENWIAGHAIAFRINPAHDIKLSVSFIDRNHVAYTSWIDLRGGVWQPVRISFDQIRPNPYFQPPDAKTGAPLDVTEVKRIGFAPHDQTSGHLAISKLVVIK